MNQRSSGFSIVELLVVIGIIGVLAAVLIPTAVNARYQSQEKAAQAIVTDMATQIYNCKVLNEEFPQDVSPMVKPSECPQLSWPVSGKLPLNGQIDYENWTWENGDYQWIGVAYMVGGRPGGIRNSSLHNQKGFFESRDPSNPKKVVFYYGIFAKTP